MARILVVDDDETDRYLEHTILESVGHEVLFAKDGADALRVFESHEISIVITDLNMPEVDGIELIREIKKTQPRTPILVVTGVDSGRLSEAQKLGVMATLDKPVDPEKLLEAVSLALGKAKGDMWGPVG